MTLVTLLCALDIHIIKVRKGKLPEKLPSNCPKDVFSGKDFIYTKTSDGFTLQCRGKDLSKNKFHEWEFKINK